MSEEVTVDLTSWEMWQEGMLLDFKDGSGKVCNETSCARAEEALLAGERVVVLGEDSRIIGYLEPEKDE